MIFRPLSDSDALTGPKSGCIPTKEVCLGRYFFIHFKGCSLTEHTSDTMASFLTYAEILWRRAGNRLIGTARMTIRFAAAISIGTAVILCPLTCGFFRSATNTLAC